LPSFTFLIFFLKNTIIQKGIDIKMRKTVKGRKKKKNSAKKIRASKATTFRIKDFLFFLNKKNGFRRLFECKAARLLYCFALLWSYVPRLFEKEKNCNYLLRFLVTLPAL
jgi:hypothetical protein